MAAIFPNQDAYPFNTIVYISVSWSDGTFTRGSGSIVGRNDILTAAHVVYDEGKTATDIDIYPAYDGAAGPWGAFTSGAWRTNYFAIDFTASGQLTRNAAANDIAIIGLSDPIGDRTGTLGLASNAPAGNYQVIGYPSGTGKRLTSDTGFLPFANGVYDIDDVYHTPGSSGGPLLNSDLRVVGVVSTTNWGARIDSEWASINTWMANNDSLIQVFFSVKNNATGVTSQVLAAAYSGPVAHLQQQFVGSDVGEVVVGGNSNDFINTMGGTDAADAGAGRDVIDGGTGSNFMTGGSGQDVFFSDGRGGGVTWSTITDWQAGEQLSLWGWRPGVSRITWADSDGTAGYKGVTMRGDLNGDGQAETIVTWTGLTRADVPTPLEFDGLLWFIG